MGQRFLAVYFYIPATACFHYVQRMTTGTTETYQARDEAEREYYFLQAEVGRFDQLSHGIKNWSITVSFALIAAAFYRGAAELCLVASIASLMFWLTEARWKRFQKIHIERIKKLEAFFEGEGEPYKGPRINKAFVEGLGSMSEGRHLEMEIMWLGNVRRPHHFIVGLGILIFVLDWYGIIPAATLPRSSGAG